MAKTKPTKSAHIQRFLEDEFAQEQLRHAAAGLKAAYGRARQERGRAVEDKRFYGNLRQTATSIREATRTFRRPEPPPKHRTRKLVTIALAVAGTVWLTAKLQKIDSRRRSNSGSRSSAPSGSATAAGSYHSSSPASAPATAPPGG